MNQEQDTLDKIIKAIIDGAKEIPLEKLVVVGLIFIGVMAVNRKEKNEKG